MTSNSFSLGLPSSERNSSKVLRPPGGISHDIFGTTDAVHSPSQRRTTDHMRSTVFDQAPPKPVSAASSDLELAIPDDNGSSSAGSRSGSISSGSVSPVTTPNGTKHIGRNPLAWDNTDGAFTPSKQRGKNGNPITGMGYGQETHEPSPAKPRARIPPGGHSSKLW